MGSISATFSTVLSLFTLSLGTNTDFASKCLSFNATSLIHNSTLRILEHVPANTTLTFPGNDPSCGRTSQIFLNEACRIALTIPTSNRSSTIFEIFLPTTSSWSGRFLGTGNGGIDGCIKVEDLSYGLSHGFATTGSNNGHNGTGGLDFYNNPDIVTDFSYRSLHTTAVAGKILTRAFYGRKHDKAYYIGCSGGGRQAIQAASLYPEDYDGIVAGCPGVNFNYMSSWRASFYTITGANTSAEFIKPGTWTGLIHNEIMKQCDSLDGVEDGILADPALCAQIFRPETLLCEPGQTSQCLSAQQVSMVRKVYSPLYGIKGELIYPGLQPGAEVQAIQRLLSGSPFSYSVDWFRYVVFNDPLWDPAAWTVADSEVAEALNPSDARSWPSTMKPFWDRGAKMVVFHGGADNQITGFNTERLYQHLERSMGVGPEKLDQFFRFFRIPGMFHCSGGPGAWMVGQSESAAIDFKANSNILSAVVEWVEGGKAPDKILGTKFVNDSAAQGVQSQRWHCRYPMQITYIGGNSSDVDSWVCK